MFDLVRNLFRIIVYLKEERIAVYSKREKIRQLQHRKVKVCTLSPVYNFYVVVGRKQSSTLGIFQ